MKERFGGRRALVTGGAGFIGSHLVHALVAEGATVVVVDSFTDYYEVGIKRDRANDFPIGVEVTEADLATTDIDALIDGVDFIFHLAGQPGVRASWGLGFDDYVLRNVIATQRLLESVVNHDLVRFVNSSSSSIYGMAETFPTPESAIPRPISPYGVTKLAAENLCGAYAATMGVPVVSLRYFTVFGPSQRPDMAIQRLCRSALLDEPFTLNGDGEQVRDFTYVTDAVEANLVAALSPVVDGTAFNIGGGAGISMNYLIDTISSISGRTLRIERGPKAFGDPAKTGADRTEALNRIGWAPIVSIEEGLAAQLQSIRHRLINRL